VELTLMRSLLAVAESGAITEAALRLRITQPALSRRIAQLERELGVTLLSRSRRGVTLTAAGLRVVEEARILVSRYEQLRQEVAALGNLEQGRIRLGGGATAVSFVLPPAIAGFQTAHPGVRFEVKEAGSGEVADDVAAGRLDLGIVTLPTPHRDLVMQPLMQDRVVLICASDHPLLRGRVRATGLRIAELHGQTLVGFEAGSAIRRIIDQSLFRAGVEMRVVMELRSIAAIVRMVASTRHLGFVSSLGVQRVAAEGDMATHSVDATHSVAGIQVLQPRGLEIRRELALVSRRDRALSPAAAAFARHLRD
jgi:DNA-binding transcriptional LysR family regulator